MARISGSVIQRQVNSYLKKNNKMSGRAGMVSDKDAYKNAQKAGEQFADVLRREIADNPILTTNVKAALDCVAYRPPRKNAEGQYEVEIYFTNDLSRPSLRPHDLYPQSAYTYDPIESLAKLYNNGVGHTMPQIWGTWHGKKGVGSRTDIPASHFMQAAVSKFDNSYSTKYGVSEIRIDDDYKQG